MKIVSLFSGIGGFDLGFIWAGHQVIWANDLWKDAVETYKLNISKHIQCKDIREVPSCEIPNCDMIIGGFPCQGFSLANQQRNEQDERNFLYLEFVRILKDKQPSFFIAENVKGILSLGKGKIFELICKDFEAIGYNVRYSVLNAANYGVPQTRERVLIFGQRKGLDININFPPKSTHQKLNGIPLFEDRQQWVSIGDALKNIPHPEELHNLENHEASKYKLRFNGYLGHRVINPDMPSPTITARGDEKGGVVVHHHPNNKRRLSPRETAIIQSFPINYKFYGTKTS
ncbi:DNA cytosine methyltransferase [Runella sp.]|jgi:DNA (cytosine-5)-methyltransferase 1|uniref:DNA cytosine methyltransferase n=1 Tax=Runella sp. TaxID=1960881 RepID=UPI00262B7A11|nr:DNA cytosine methyltransferase [Runella sp.]